MSSAKGTLGLQSGEEVSAVANADPSALSPQLVEELKRLAEQGQDGHEELLRRIAHFSTTTGDGGEQAYLVKRQDRHMVAAFREGLLLCEHGTKFTPLVRTVQSDFKKRFGHSISCLLELPGVIIHRVYDAAKLAGSGGIGIDDETEALEHQGILRAMLMDAVMGQASDVHIRVTPRLTEVRYRVFGRMTNGKSLSVEEGQRVMRAALAISDDTVAKNDRSYQQGALTHASNKWLPKQIEMVRLAYTPSSEGRGALVMRLKYRSKPGERDVDSLGYTQAQAKDIALMRRRTNGLYILSGKVSSGKSTTLERAMNAMYHEKNGEITIFTIEEPIELNIPNAVQVAITAATEEDRRTAFQDAIKSALRSDPNVIVVGEIRDPGIAYYTIQGALTGHAMWSTVHAGKALSILDRLLDLEVALWKITDPSVTRGLIYQRLVGTLCPHCRISYAQGIEEGRLDRGLAEDVARLFQMELEELYLRSKNGCTHCIQGLNGRTVVAEVVLVDQKLLDYYRIGERGRMHEHWMKDRAEGGLGGRPVIYHALMKVAQGIADINEVEEEVDLVSSFVHEYGHLVEKMRAEIDEMLGRKSKCENEAA
ncbi:GspE/PulE family protein [Amorphus sp. 3PC139-8]|uniref:GspE/PulE family protein n=1 Tax=Amorphus sp. 3PC139-8 TaxID=2735676 RepID=UPI00345D3F15